MLALRTVLSSESRLLLLGFFYFRVWRKAGGEGNVQGRLPLPLPVFPGASSTVPLLASPLNFQAHIHSRVPLEGRSWKGWFLPWTVASAAFNKKLTQTQRWITNFPINLQDLILLQTTTNISIKALLIDAALGNPSVAIHYSGYNFSLSGWQLIPSTLVYSGNYQEQKEPLN